MLLDLNLPDASGPELIRSFHAHAPHVPLIAHTAAGELARLGDAQELVVALVAKGRNEDLLAALAAATGR